MADRVVLDNIALYQLLKGPNGAVWQDIHRRGNRVLNRARVLCPVDEGRLRASLTLEMRREGEEAVARVGTNLEYGLYVHEGTGIYGPRKTPIRPVRARLLRWPAKNNSGAGRRRYKGGKTARYIYARQVKGVKPRRYLANALSAAKR